MSLRAIVTIPSDVVILCDETCISISRNQRAEIKKQYMDYKMRQLLEPGTAF